MRSSHLQQVSSKGRIQGSRREGLGVRVCFGELLVPFQAEGPGRRTQTSAQGCSTCRRTP